MPRPTVLLEPPQSPFFHVAPPGLSAARWISRTSVDSGAINEAKHSTHTIDRITPPSPPAGHTEDLPPKGGYEPVRYKRNLPVRGPGGLAIFGGVLAICAYGFYRVGQGNLEMRELKRENAWSRIHIVPLLQAEADRDTYRRDQAALAREKEIMKDVEGWEAGKSVYHTKRYSPRTVVVL